MAEKRRYFLAHPRQTRQMIDQCAALGFVLGGPCYKRPPQTSEDPVLMELLARKYFYFEKPVSMETVYASSLVDTLAEGYTQLADFYHFFNKQS